MTMDYAKRDTQIPLDRPRFRRIYVVEPSHDMSRLRKYTNRIEFLTSGYEKVEELYAAITIKLMDFDPSTDAIVPVGRVVPSMVSGILLQKMFSEFEITIGIYKEKDYEFYSLPDGYPVS